jgi:hypothetical protein
LTNSSAATIIWFVSNCHTRSRREEYIQTLGKHVGVDIYGRCEASAIKGIRPYPCPYETDKDECSACTRDLMRPYKFFLAFENQQCNDYISEKFWKFTYPENIFDIDILPVVRGARDGQYATIAYETHSYVNADNFKSPEALAEYLNYLDRNETAYSEYFAWKRKLIGKFERHMNDLDKGKVTQKNKQYIDRMEAPFCEVCSKLHDEEFLKKRDKKPVKLSEMFDPQKNCWDKPLGFPYNLLEAPARLIGFCMD